MEISEVLTEDLQGRIHRMKKEIESASLCLEDGDYLQCAIRLQDAAMEASFDDLHLSIMDSMSGNENN